jgi:hypothetical protein
MVHLKLVELKRKHLQAETEGVKLQLLQVVLGQQGGVSLSAGAVKQSLRQHGTTCVCVCGVWMWVSECGLVGGLAGG